MPNTFKIAGWSTLNGKLKARFANDMATRVKTLAKNEHQDIQLFDLGGEMTKAQACQWLLDNTPMNDEVRGVISGELAKQTPKASKAEAVETEGAATEETAAEQDDEFDGQDDIELEVEDEDFAEA